MTKSEAGKLGAQKTALRDRTEALENYYKNPNNCIYCGSVIEVKGNESPSSTRKRKFCSHSCAASFNNRKTPKRKAITEGSCLNCGTTINYKKYKNGRYSRRKYCESCHRRRCSAANQKRSGQVACDLAELTLNELEQRYGSKTSQKLRSFIVKNSRGIYKKSGKSFVCKICGYDKHVNICHITSWTKFNKHQKLKDVNSLSNLICLRPNHHWEFDHNLLDDKDKAVLALK